MPVDMHYRGRGAVPNRRTGPLDNDCPVRRQEPSHGINDLHRSILFPVVFVCHQGPAENRQGETGGDDQNFDGIVFHFLSLSF